MYKVGLNVKIIRENYKIIKQNKMQLHIKNKNKGNKTLKTLVIFANFAKNLGEMKKAIPWNIVFLESRYSKLLKTSPKKAFKLSVDKKNIK